MQTTGRYLWSRRPIADVSRRLTLTAEGTDPGSVRTVEAWALNRGNGSALRDALDAAAVAVIEVERLAGDGTGLLRLHDHLDELFDWLGLKDPGRRRRGIR